ncbi:concanavalin A-like lectin/glucanase domain-containing protein [Artemisia annua]|uniref:Concanavalin A-like lectin/glucanase domain-containing protein n=1 Tax=Artemisia annua TaxID=35608 RepID=A0A2U1MMZ6_ARTAN|nr:concanavalin A-like lectin/glucanase domain-containing protein [Artemisia annua]
MGFVYILILNVQISTIDARVKNHVSFSPDVAPMPSLADSSPGGETHSNKKLIIGLIAASSFTGIVLLPLICLLIYRRSKKFKSKKTKGLDSLRGLPLIKRLDNQSRDGIKEFQTEVDILSKIQHPNVINLLGYCVYDETRLLVYELMPNGSLDTQLHGPSCGSNLTWHCRMKIALDTARGLEYLHEHCKPSVIHRDLKTSNILLDSNYNAKLSDFGLAVMDGASREKIKLSGTLGYVAPEYLLDGKLTDKSDVYAFGVVLLELLLRRRPVEKLAPSECQSIVNWAMPHLTDRTKLPSVIDPVIRDTMDLKHLYQVAAVAVLCVQPEPSYRPLITDVLHSLVPLVPVDLGGTLRVGEYRVAATLEP